MKIDAVIIFKRSELKVNRENGKESQKREV